MIKIQNYIKSKLIRAKEKGYIDYQDLEITTFLIYKMYIALVIEWGSKDKNIDRQVLAKTVSEVLRKGLRKEVRNEDVVEHLLEAFKQKIQEMKFITPEPIIIPQDYFIRKIQRKGLCAILSDIHSGDEVISEVTPYNNYNYEIMFKQKIKII